MSIFTLISNVNVILKSPLMYFVSQVHIFLEEGTHTLSFLQPGDSIDLSGPGNVVCEGIVD